MNQKLSFDVLITELAATDPIDEQILTDRIAPAEGDVTAEPPAGPAGAPAGTRPALTVGASASVAPLRRRTWPLIAAAACLAVIAVTAAVVALLPGTSEPAYAITLDGEVVVVNWVRDLRDGTAIGEGPAAYGVDATVRAVPASPSRVGRVLTVAVNGVEAGEMPPGVSWGADGTDEVFTWRIDPTQFRDSIQIEIGVEPEPDEPYVVAESAFAPGEVLGGLHCALESLDLPVIAAAVDKQLRRLDLDVHWFRMTEATGSASGDLGEELPSRTPPAGTVLDVQPIDSRTVRVSVAPPGASLTAPIFTPVRPSAACTPELASRWLGVI